MKLACDWDVSKPSDRDDLSQSRINGYHCSFGYNEKRTAYSGIAFIIPRNLLLLGITVMVGQIWRVYYRFHGGGGLATALGIFLVVDPLDAFVSVLLAVIIGMFIIHETAICFLGGPRLFLVWISFRTGNWYLILFNLLINSLLIIAVLPDISTALKKGDIKISTGMDIVPLARPINAFLEKFRNKLKGDKETAENDNVRIGVKQTKK